MTTNNARSAHTPLRNYHVVVAIQITLKTNLREVVSLQACSQPHVHIIDNTLNLRAIVHVRGLVALAPNQPLLTGCFTAVCNGLGKVDTTFQRLRA